MFHAAQEAEPTHRLAALSPSSRAFSAKESEYQSNYYGNLILVTASGALLSTMRRVVIHRSKDVRTQRSQMRRALHFRQGGSRLRHPDVVIRGDARLLGNWAAFANFRTVLDAWFHRKQISRWKGEDCPVPVGVLNVLSDIPNKFVLSKRSYLIFNLRISNIQIIQIYR